MYSLPEYPQQMGKRDCGLKHICEQTDVSQMKNEWGSIWFKMSSLELAETYATHIEKVKNKGKAATIIL